PPYSRSRAVVRKGWWPNRTRALGLHTTREQGKSGSGLGNSGLEDVAERLAYGRELDPVEDVVEEPAHDEPLRLGAREPARHEVEEHLAIHLAARRAVRAPRVVREDLEAGYRVRVRLLREEQVAVLLVGVRLLGVFLDADHPAPHGGGRVAQGALEREVGLRVRRDVLLEGVVVQVLVAVREVRARHPRRRAGTGEVVLDPRLAL